MSFTPDPAQWPFPFVGVGLVDPDQLLFAPANCSIHPHTQQLAIDAVLATFGWLLPVVVNVTTGHLLDGQARVYRASVNRQQVFVLYVKLEAEVEPLAVLAFTALAKMAFWDSDLPYTLDHEGQKVTTSQLSKLDETVGDLAKVERCRALLGGLIKAGALKIGAASRSRTAARKASIEHLREVQYQCARHGYRVYLPDGYSTVRLYGEHSEVTAFMAAHPAYSYTRIG